MAPVLIGIILTSCSAVLQKAYLETSPNLNRFTREKEKNVKVSLFVNHYEVQSNVALSRHLGVSAGINGGFKHQFGGEVAGIFYEDFTDKFYFELQGGYGCFNNKSVINSISWSFGSIGEYGTFFSQHIDTRYQKLFIQPEWVYHTEKIDLAVACKMNANYFDNYHYDYCIEDHPDDYDYYQTISSSDFRYKWNFSLEPAVKIQFHSKLFL